jgi:hypothetical protein
MFEFGALNASFVEYFIRMTKSLSTAPFLEECIEENIKNQRAVRV